MGKYDCEGQISIYDINDSAMNMERYLYALIDNSIYELPICVCDSVEELSDMTNTPVADINDLIRKAEQRGGKSKFIRIKLDDSD